MFTACSAFALLGWRVVSRVDRIEHKTGVLVALDKAFASIPLPIPTTKAGVALAVAGAILGWGLARFGKWAEKAL